MIRVTLDTNIYVSALQFGREPRRLLDIAIDGGIQVAISQPLMNEILRVLGQKFGWSVASLREAEALITGFARRVTPTERVNVVKDDPDDNRILECAAAAASDFIVSGDRDLLRLGKYRDARIVKVAEMLDLVHRRGGRNPAQ